MMQRAVNNAMVLYELGITSEELQTAREITEKVPALLNVLMIGPSIRSIDIKTM